ncbi:cutinase family protein [Streptomyces sp. NPDC087903]|uniref:cutinase family protein n=1 Tax=Streptomyces sp. NPDC087903 TaxID=3365819 RepID=UPI0038014A94
MRRIRALGAAVGKLPSDSAAAEIQRSGQRHRSTAAVLTLLLTLAATLLSPGSARAQGETIILDPAEGPEKTSVTVTGHGWIDAAGHDVSITIRTTEVTTAHPDSHGDFETHLTIPEGTPPGPITIGASSGNSHASAPFKVTEPTPVSTPPSPPSEEDCPEWLVFGVKGVKPPPLAGDTLPFADKIIEEAQTLHGVENVGVTWLDYERPAFKDVFTGNAVQAAVNAATSEPQPQGLLLPFGKDALPPALLKGREDGVNRAVGLLRLQAARCPNQHFILAGHSLGAWVLGDALPELRELYPRVDAVLLAGDPMFDPDSSAAERPDTLDQAGPLKTMGIAAHALGLRKPSYLPEELLDVAQSYCYASPLDPICATPKAGVLDGKTWARHMDACRLAVSGGRLGLEAAEVVAGVIAQSECGHIDYKGDYAARFLAE